MEGMEVDLKMVSMVEGIKVEDLNLEDRILPLPVILPALLGHFSQNIALILVRTRFQLV